MRVSLWIQNSIDIYKRLHIWKSYVHAIGGCFLTQTLFVQTKKTNSKNVYVARIFHKYNKPLREQTGSVSIFLWTYFVLCFVLYFSFTYTTISYAHVCKYKL